MSYMVASVVEIENCDTLHHVKFDCYGHIISMISLELPESLTVGKKVKLAVKASHVTIAKNLSGTLSYANQIPMVIHTITHGKLLNSIKLQFSNIHIEAIVLRAASEKMNLKEGDAVTSLMQASEISICEILDD